MDYKQGIDRSQLFMMNLEEYVSSDSWARAVDWFVEALPLSELGFKDELPKEGCPPYRASDLLKLLMYGYKKSIRSSRKLEESCKINLEVMWLLKGLRPSARTIAYFRKDNAEAFKKTFRHFVLLLKQWELIDGEIIAIDSFKIRAQNSLKNNFNQKKIDRHLAYIDKKIAEYENALNKDTTVDEQQKEGLKTKIKDQQAKKDNYKAIEKQLKACGEKQISTIDPDAKAVVLHRNIVNVGYNIQTGCDSKYKLFTNAQTGMVNDTHALADMAMEAKELLGVAQMDTLTDKGYTTGYEIARCKQNDITTYSAPKAHSSQKNGLFDMQIFIYNKQKDSYTCPAGQTLTTNGSIYNKRNHKVKHYKTKACKGCQLRAQCTTNKNGRFIERSIYQEDVEENEKRVLENPDYYRKRQQITEHQFGTLKRQWGFTYTLMKGKEHVLSEVNLLMSCYNLKRMMSIFDLKTLKNKLNKLVFIFYRIMGFFKAINKGFFIDKIIKRFSEIKNKSPLLVSIRS